MKKLLAIAALTVLTTASASAATYHQRAQVLQSYASADELMISQRDSATGPYVFGPQISGSSVVQ
jgi:hypothetical protein